MRFRLFFRLSSPGDFDFAHVWTVTAEVESHGGRSGILGLWISAGDASITEEGSHGE